MKSWKDWPPVSGVVVTLCTVSVVPLLVAVAMMMSDVVGAASV